ncbi:hypothetical protein FKM82_028177, partial [Ascaphus truei]
MPRDNGEWQCVRARACVCVCEHTLKGQHSTDTMFLCCSVAPEVLVPLVDVTCVLGDTVTLHCRVCGRPKPSITWKGPDQNVLDSDSNTYTVSASDSGDITLRICNLMPQDSGIYTCVAGNELGVATTSATIKVQ